MAELPLVGRALLETIAGPESAGAYDVIYGGSKFNDFSDHPRQFITITSGPNKGQKSSAAGKYQFLGSTWDDQASKLGLTDFSPASQDLAAWNLAKEEYKRDTGRNLQADLEAGDLSRVAPSLRNQWTSMPGGIEQGISGGAFSAAFNNALNRNGPIPPKPIPTDADLADLPLPRARPNTVPRSLMSYAGENGGRLGYRLPDIGPKGGPALNAFSRAAGPTARQPTGQGGFWKPLASLMGANIPSIPRPPSQAQNRSLMSAAMGSLPVRTAFANTLMRQNIGAAPTVSTTMPTGGGRVSQAYAVNGSGEQPVFLTGNSPTYANANSDPWAGTNSDVYRANAAAIGGRITQDSINQALSEGRTLYKPR